MARKQLLCVDFEFHDEIYNKISERNKFIDVTIINRTDKAVYLLASEDYDFLITTIISPSKTTGLELIDEIKNNPDKYGKPLISVLTGLGGDTFYEEILRREVELIDRYERPIELIEDDIDLFLRYPFEEITSPYPTEHVEQCSNDRVLQNKEKPAGLLEFHHPEKCSNCAHSKFSWIRFISPLETWQMLCGRDVWLLICSNCKKQFEQIINRMN